MKSKEELREELRKLKTETRVTKTLVLGMLLADVLGILTTTLFNDQLRYLFN